MVGAAKRKPVAWSRDTPWPIGVRLLSLLWSALLISRANAAKSAGCADSSREALQGFERVAGCAGQWKGHVHNASALCGPGWRVCAWYDHVLLSNITWSQATQFPGCYAFNAAQDGGRCQECRDDLEQDDLAGVGKDCAHQHRGQSSCISGGRIDSSCCVDSHFHRACSFQDHLTTGALCCRMPVKPPVIVVKPPERMHVYTGLIFLLPCQATGMPPPRIQWYKNGEQMPADSPRASVLSSGDLLVTLARKSDTALYTCEVINEEGFDMASSYVTVTEYSSGCADDSTEGLHLYRDIQACSGQWEGHVRLGKTLCKKGWRVCNPKDKDALAQLTWLDIFDLSGCYAYNAASRRGRCRKCKDGKMAGVGRACQWMRHTQSSCLAGGRVEVLHPRNSTSCTQVEGVTSGVVCCKRKKRRNKKGKTFQCVPSCQHKGTCISHNRCKCSSGYKGARCQNAICDPGCGPKGECVKPNKCRCHKGYGGRLCRTKVHGKCHQPCLNGARCHHGKCRCAHGYWGKSCQHVLQQFVLSQLNRTER
ncbi:uncharacterized protein [Littorina saxatilis]|uniref:Uncharacterized protein n=1 Tax=Littorina saxatilis TaxID=31220 RepID=A0AAN9BPF8_9CAEN